MTKAPYIVYTPDKDFVLEKDDISGGSSGGGVFIIESEQSESGMTLKKTWKEIKDAFIIGKQCIVSLILETEETNIKDYSIVTNVNEADSVYSIYIYGNEKSEFIADSENGYPIYVANNG